MAKSPNAEQRVRPRGLRPALWLLVALGAVWFSLPRSEYLTGWTSTALAGQPDSVFETDAVFETDSVFETHAIFETDSVFETKTASEDSITALSAAGQSATAQSITAQPITAQSVTAQSATSEGPPSRKSFSEQVGGLFRTLVLLFFLAFFLLAAVALLLLWRAKKLVENAVRPDQKKLERILERLRRRNPELSEREICRKIIHRQANQAGLVGLVTGLGGLFTLPLALPVDIALSIRIQASLVHMLRLVRDVPLDEVPESGLWLITTGGQELTAASGVALREYLVRFFSKSMLKFLPILGGVVGFLLNWGSTQALGRLTERWLDNHLRQNAAKLEAGSGEASPQLPPQSTP